MKSIDWHYGTTCYTADLTEGIDISIPVRDGARNVNAWGVGPPKIQPYQQGSFTGSIESGASVNFNDIAFNPHAHGTHTECLGHIRKESDSVYSNPPDAFLLARLLTVVPERNGEDRVISLEQLRSSFGDTTVDALILRTLPNGEEKRNYQYSGTNPPYLQAEAAGWLREQGIQHLLIDLPSVDREEDKGALAAHKAFWGLPKAPRPGATITELIYVPGNIQDGLYLLNLQMAAFENDAAPSRPLLFKLKKK